jgi:hypothetical protein
MVNRVPVLKITNEQLGEQAAGFATWVTSARDRGVLA